MSITITLPYRAAFEALPHFAVKKAYAFQVILINTDESDFELYISFEQRIMEFN